MRNLLIVALLAVLTGCASTSPLKFLSQTDAQSNKPSEGVAKAAIKAGATVAPTGFDWVPKDGVGVYAEVTDLTRNPDNTVYHVPGAEVPVPSRSTFRGAWNLTTDFVGGLAEGEVTLGAVEWQADWRLPVWSGFKAKIGGTNVQTNTDPAVIRALGEANAIEKAATGEAAALFLRENYAGKVAMMKAGTQWLVEIREGVFGVLERIDPVAAAVSLGKSAVKISAKDPNTGEIVSKIIEK